MKIELKQTEESKRWTPGSRAIVVDDVDWGMLAAHGNGSHGTYYTMQDCRGNDVVFPPSRPGGRERTIRIESNKTARRADPPNTLPALQRAVIAIEAAIGANLFLSPTQLQGAEERALAAIRAERERESAARHALAKETLTALNYWKAGALLDEDTAVKVMLTAFAASRHL